MHIHLIGGSNTGIWDGWAHHFVLAVERDLSARVTNGFLGAVGSLFGLYRLQRLKSDGEPFPDVVVFEYALNDIVFADGRVISTRLVRETLMDAADFCVRAGIALQFLCLAPRDLRCARVSRRIARAYEDVARNYGLPPPLSQREAMARVIVDGDYLDEHHLNPDASRAVAAALVRRLSTLALRTAPPVASPPRRSFAFVDATRAATAGRAWRSTCTMTVLSGPVVEMRRPSSATFPAEGRLVGVLFRSRRSSGWYRIGVGGALRRKNACESALAFLPEAVSMQYPRVRTLARGAVEIAMPDYERALMRLPHDRSPMPWGPEAPFGDQELALFGVVLWRETSVLARIRVAVRAARKAVRRSVQSLWLAWLAERDAPARKLRYRRRRARGARGRRPWICLHPYS